MSESGSQGRETTPQERDEHRLHLERESVLNQREQIYLEQWRTDVLTAENRAQNASNAAVQAGQQGLRTLALVHAGALIGLPSFAKGFSQISLTANDLIYAMTTFVSGLFFTFIGMLFAYLTNFWQANAQFRDAEQRAIRVNSQGREKTEDELSCENQLHNELQRYQKLVGRGQFLSVGSAIMAIVLFAVGAGLGLTAVR